MNWLAWLLVAVGVRFGDAAGCFVPTTKVTMADGSKQMIGNVQIGDWMTSWDEEKRVSVPAKVLGIKRTRRLDLLQLKCGNQPVITSSRDHPYWSVKQNSLVSADPATTQLNYGLEARDFLENDVLQAADGSSVSCVVISRADSEELRDLLTLQLEDHHWFFVEGVRVHNKGSSGCFVLKTLVTMADESLRAIGEVQVGDSVMSWDEQKQIAAPAKVLKLKRARRSDLLKVQLESGAVITSTRDHPFWSMKQASLVSADPEGTKWSYDLSAKQFLDNEVLQAANGSAVNCQVVSREDSVHLEDVMTLFLEGHHWFFVEGVRVHNKGSSCFVPSTLVTMADERTQAIGDVQIGDSVMSWDESKNVATTAKVFNIKRAQRSDMQHVTLKSGPVIVSTADHPFWSLKQGSLISGDPQATRLNYGLISNNFHVDEVLQTSNGSGIACQMKLVKSEELLDVITLELQDHHWFFAEGVRVHNKGSTSTSGGSSSTPTSSRYSGSFTGTSGIYFSTYIPYRSTYYSRSPYCRSYPTAYQCASSDPGNMQCGCQGTSNDATSYPQYCPPAALHGSCWPSGQNSTCVPSMPELPKNDSRYLSAIAYCANEITNCTNNTECYDEMLRYNYSAGVLYWTNFSFSIPENVTDDFLDLSMCMTSQINFCRCTWEICEEGVSAGFWVGVILGPLCGIICISFTVWCCCIKYKKRNFQQSLLMGASCKHDFEAVECVELSKRTGNNLYLEGYICDVCKGSFSVTHKPTHCFKCGMDFCDGCLANLGGHIQELPPYSEPTSAACLENATHCTQTMLCSAMDATYANGFICDACHGQFPQTVKFERCAMCRLDFCAGCSLRRAKSAAPPSEEAWSDPQKNNATAPPSVELVSMEPVSPPNSYSSQSMLQASTNAQDVYSSPPAAGGYSSPQAADSSNYQSVPAPVSPSGPPPDDLPANPFVAQDGSGYTNFQGGLKQTDGYSNLQDDSFAANNNNPSYY